MRNSRITSSIAAYIVLLLMIWPLIYIFISSFKPLKEIMNYATVFAKEPTLKNYETLLFAKTSVRNFPRMIFNSMVVSFSSALLTVVISCMTGYCIARSKRLKGSFITKLILFIYVFPTIILLIPIYKLFSGVGLWDNLLSLVIVCVALSSPFCSWLLVSFFDSIPIELEESAQIDGANGFKIFVRIVFPITIPGILTSGMYAFISAWGEYMFALTLINTGSKKPASLGLASFTSEQYIEWGPLLAGSILVILPVIVLFLPLSRNFIKGFMSGAMKE